MLTNGSLCQCALDRSQNAQSPACTHVCSVGPFETASSRVLVFLGGAAISVSLDLASA